MAGLGRRAALVEVVACALLARTVAHPLRIGIDGRTAAGKTTFADELGRGLGGSGRDIVRASIDDFHHPAAVRHRKGRFSPDGYYEDARDHAALRRLVLDPGGPAGSRQVATRSFDLASDRPIHPEHRRIGDDALLIVDGSFLQRPDLEGAWDVMIFLKVAALEARRRGIARDRGALGGEDVVTRLYDERYEPAFARYERECHPEPGADLVIGNDDPASPNLILRKRGAG